jgi:hypothetical protein
MRVDARLDSFLAEIGSDGDLDFLLLFNELDDGHRLNHTFSQQRGTHRAARLPFLPARE